MTSADPRSQHGFTLLEVMCAFAILAGVTGFLTVIYFHAIDRGSTAVELRELREAADTVFRHLIYEEHKWDDGSSKSLAETYAEWAGLPVYDRKRWDIYRWELRKERKVAAGQPDPNKNEEALFETQGDQDTRSTSSSSSSSTSSSSSSSNQSTDTAPGQALWKFTMSIYMTDSGDDKPLLVLRTFIPVRDDPTTSSTGTASGATR